MPISFNYKTTDFEQLVNILKVFFKNYLYGLSGFNTKQVIDLRMEKQHGKGWVEQT